MIIYFSNINNPKLNEIHLENRIPFNFLKEARKYKKSLDYRRSLVAYYLLYEYLLFNKKIYEFTPVKILKNNHGKPYLKGIDNCYFNITHSGDWVAVAISNTEVGIDLEYNESFDFDEVIDYVLSDREKIFFLQLPDVLKCKTFYRFWTLKESFVKAMGIGLAKYMNSFTTELWSKNICVTGEKNFKFYELPFYEKYSLSVCCNISDEIENMVEVKILL